MLSRRAYIAPAWAEDLSPKPVTRFNLAHLPTPIHRWSPPGFPASARMWIKRDDLSGLETSGNKIRKLEFLLADAVTQGADTVVTIGGVQSNHCRSTCAAARLLGLNAELILRVPREDVGKDPGLTGNLMLSRMMGARLHTVSREAYQLYGSDALVEARVDQLREEEKVGSSFAKPYGIPVGGSNPLGTWGYLEMARELGAQQEEVLGGSSGGDGGGGGGSRTSRTFDIIAMACGSGGTTAGLALGAKRNPQLSSARVIGLTVCDSVEYFYDFIDGLYDGLGAKERAKECVELLAGKGRGCEFLRCLLPD